LSDFQVLLVFKALLVFHPKLFGCDSFERDSFLVAVFSPRIRGGEEESSPLRRVYLGSEEVGRVSFLPRGNF